MNASELREEVSRITEDLEELADQCDAAGIGQDPRSGHSTILRGMAAAMRSDASAGRTPYSFTNPQITAPLAGGNGPRSEPFLATVRTLRLCGIDPSQRVNLAELNAAMDKAQTPTSERFSVKADLLRIGWLS